MQWYDSRLIDLLFVASPLLHDPLKQTRMRETDNIDHLQNHILMLPFHTHTASMYKCEQHQEHTPTSSTDDFQAARQHLLHTTIEALTAATQILAALVRITPALITLATALLAFTIAVVAFTFTAYRAWRK